MVKEMFCFQCEQTAGCQGCTGNAGVCGKSWQAANAQDDLTKALIGLSQELSGKTPEDAQRRLMLEGLFTTLTNVSFEEERIMALTQQVNAQRKGADMDDCAASGTPLKLWAADEDIRSLKSLILFGLRGMAAYAYHAWMLGAQDEEVSDFFFEGLRAVGDSSADLDALLPVVMKVGEINFKCMAMLDKANTERYGTPVPATVSMTIEKGPFIVVTGHDLKDLELLLEQTKGKGIHIYTHGEMLPAHAYPKLHAYPHLKGNFGTAWQNQQQEFANIPAAVLYTTNCLMPPKDSYADRIFTTEVVAFPGVTHIGEEKDFTPVIEKALALGGYPEEKTLTGINGGTQMVTGFGHKTILSLADKVVEAVKSGAIKHFFLVAGCDGAKAGRNYYTDFVKLTPPDSVILTLACGKYRFNDLDLGTVAGIPRLLDMGQCNDAYGAIQVAVALSEAFGCDVNDLPLSFVLSWYEQKAVCILLTLLHLGIKNIRLGPSLPAFLSPNVREFLVDHFGIAPITTPAQDLQALLQ